MTVYKQKTSGPCGNYAYLVALNKLGATITEEEILKLGNFLTNTRALSYLRRVYPKIREERMRSPQMVNLRLSQGYTVIAHTSLHSFDEVRNPPYINRLSGTKSHYFLIVEDKGDMWKCQDSQGEEFAELGFWYLPKTLFNKLITPTRVII